MIRRRAIAGLTLLAFVAASVGFPIPEFRTIAQINDDEDFPCKGHNCGCHDAVSCREHCCCGFRVVKKGEEPPAHSCCAEDEADGPDHTDGGVTLAISSLGCRGVSTIYIALGVVLPVTSPIAISGLVPSQMQIALINDRADSFSIDPAVPPPRA